MYKKVSPLPEELTLVLKYKNNDMKISFDEPTIYTIYEIEKLFKNKKYLEIIKKLNIPIEEKVFLSNPVGILKALINLINGKGNNKKESEEDDFFLFSIFDRLADKYGVDPLFIMKNYTASQIKSVSEGVNFNKNIDDDKKYKNDIYLDQEYIEKRNKKYEDTMKRVYEAKEKLGYT